MAALPTMEPVVKDAADVFSKALQTNNRGVNQTPGVGTLYNKQSGEPMATANYKIDKSPISVNVMLSPKVDEAGKITDGVKFTVTVQERTDITQDPNNRGTWTPKRITAQKQEALNAVSATFGDAGLDVVKKAMQQPQDRYVMNVGGEAIRAAAKQKGIAPISKGGQDAAIPIPPGLVGNLPTIQGVSAAGSAKKGDMVVPSAVIKVQPQGPQIPDRR